MIVGYARVSTLTQNEERQVKLLKEHGCEKIFVDKMTGKTLKRPKLTELKNFVRSGDTVLVESWNRLSRSLKDLLDTIHFFEEKGVKVISIKENFDTSTPQGKLMLNIFAALSEFEAECIKERSYEGLIVAKEKGVPLGRPKTPQDRIDLAMKLKAQGDFSVPEIAKITGVSESTIYRRQKKMREERMKKEE